MMYQDDAPHYPEQYGSFESQPAIFGWNLPLLNGMFSQQTYHEQGLTSSNTLTAAPFEPKSSHAATDDPIGNRSSAANSEPQSQVPDLVARVRILPEYDQGDQRECIFPVSRIGSYFGLDYSGAVFAVFNRKTCLLIDEMQAKHRVQLYAYTEPETLKRALASHTSKSPAIISVDLNIYGERQDATDVGRVLSSHKLFLQQPIHKPESATYYCPHFLHVQEVLGQSLTETPWFELCRPQQLLSQQQNGPRASEHLLDAHAEPASIFNSLSQHAYLHKRAADKGIKTTLKDHQMEAIDFMLRRETGALPSDLMLWNEMESENGEVICQHIITGTRRARPAETQGGILADEMGLGKTIVTLSVIASTLDGALKFASEQSTGNSTEERRRSRATLVIAPSSHNWVDEIRNHTYSGCFRFLKYHGQGRQDDLNRLFQYDIVLTTYATICSESNRGRSVLGDIEWFRIVLDEAHDIRNRNTRQFQVVTKFSARHRWCLTGTPIQNTLDDLGALVAFLRVPLLENAASFQRFITNQSKPGTRHRFKHLRTLLESICLRRTKEKIGLSDPVEHVRILTLSPTERKEYNDLLRRYETLQNMGVSGHSKRGDTAKVQSFLRLRLFCNNGSFSSSLSNMRLGPDELLSYLQQIDMAVCAYCDRTIYDINDVPGTDGGHLLPECSHLVCRDCLAQHCAQKRQCPRCTDGTNETGAQDILADLNPLQAPLDSGPRTIMPATRYPTKLLAFLEDIQQQTAQKSITFSSWTKTLELAGQLLHSKGIPFHCIHGALPLSAVGLNLAVASRIYLLEPQWNPSVEQQAFGRALRLGQTEQVIITRYVMQDTVEDSNVVSRQNTKLQLAVGGFRKRKRDDNLYSGWL
ncbi:hypothetical protein DL768_007170 [Monosporascus sp. mg162]|nr:hypothetical protein DL768_007170 [Monosporascus sp. mg162]